MFKFYEPYDLVSTAGLGPATLIQDGNGKKTVQYTRLCLIAQNQYNRIPPEEHFTDKSVFVHGLFVLALRDFCPHLFYILKNHITVSVKSFHSSEQLLVVSQGNKNLSMISDGLLKYGQRALRDLVLL